MASSSSSRLHWLPLSLDAGAEGPAPVDAYFKPRATDATCAGAPVEEAAFRGRRLLGTTLPLPPGYAAFVLPPAPADPEPLPDSPSEAAAAAGPPPPRVWPASAAHASITYWLLDAHPAPTDGARRAVEWVGVAEAAAGHVGAGEVDERSTIVC